MLPFWRKINRGGIGGLAAVSGGATEFLYLIPGPSGGPGEVQEEFISGIIVSPSSSTAAMQQTGVSLAEKRRENWIKVVQRDKNRQSVCPIVSWSASWGVTVTVLCSGVNDYQGPLTAADAREENTFIVSPFNCLRKAPTCVRSFNLQPFTAGRQSPLKCVKRVFHAARRWGESHDRDSVFHSRREA